MGLMADKKDTGKSREVEQNLIAVSRLDDAALY